VTNAQVQHPLAGVKDNTAQLFEPQPKSELL
jgi:hypothetical protein